MKKSLQDGKRYLPTSYRHVHHCEKDASECGDHCYKFASSDPTDPDLQKKCAHEHKDTCLYCDNIKGCLDEKENVMKSDSIDSNEQKEDLLCDFKLPKQFVSGNHIL